MTAAKRRKQRLRNSIKKLQEEVARLTDRCEGLDIELSRAADKLHDAYLHRMRSESERDRLLRAMTEARMMEPPPPIIVPAELAEAFTKKPPSEK